jgi:hypothetical protein
MLVPGDQSPDVDALLVELEEADGAVRALYREVAADPDRAGEYDPRLKDLHARRLDLAQRVGLVTRLAAIPLIIDMLVAIATTKVPILVKSGFWAAAHEARTDYAMLLGGVFLLLVGGGRLSVDARLLGSKVPDG